MGKQVSKPKKRYEGDNKKKSAAAANDLETTTK